MLGALGLPASSWRAARGDRCRLDVYAATRREAERTRGLLRPLLGELGSGGPLSARIGELPAQDWAEGWKRFFHAERVSGRIVVRPSWERFKARPGDCVLEIDPGMSFGTGQHATTRGCLRLLDALAAGGPPRSLLDAGSGSGILAVAAVKLGCVRVSACDIDPEAVAIAGQNARRNRVADRIRFFIGDVRRLRPPPKYDAIVANLLAPLLVECAGRLAKMLSRRASSRLIASGILRAQYAGVQRALARQGLREERRIALGNWTSGCFAWEHR